MDEQKVDPERREASRAAAWTALGTIGAAVVAAVVTLITVYLPSSPPMGGQPAAPASRVPPPSAATPSGATTPTNTPAATVPPVPRSSLLVAFGGRWQGEVSAGGLGYTMTLDIPDTCAEGLPCGTMTTDLYGCVGELVLIRIGDGPQFDLATVSFTEGSSSSCELRPEGGDYFTMGRDVLVYATGYDGSRRGTLRRIS